MSLESKIREGTEVLRTGGGAKLTAKECNALIDLLEASAEISRQIVGAVQGGYMLMPNTNEEVDDWKTKLEKVRGRND